MSFRGEFLEEETQNCSREDEKIGLHCTCAHVFMYVCVREGQGILVVGAPGPVNPLRKARWGSTSTQAEKIVKSYCCPQFNMR